MVENENEIIEKDVSALVGKADKLINNNIIKINCELMNLYWSIGKLVGDYRSKSVSDYGKEVIKRFSEELYIKHGKSFNLRNIYHAIRFYEIFPNLNLASNFKNVNWSHIRELVKFKDIVIINFYLNEIENKNLTKDELINNIKSKSFERTISNQRKDKLKNEIENTLKDPIILNIENKKRSEKQLEDEIIKNVFSFMNELGDAVSLFGRQYKININALIHKVDLVFLDYKTNTFIKD